MNRYVFLSAIALFACDRGPRNGDPSNSSTGSESAGSTATADASAAGAADPQPSSSDGSDGGVVSDAADAGTLAVNTAPAAPVEPPIARPCQITVERSGSAEPNVARVYRVRPEGVALGLSTVNATLTFRYDAQGRIVSAGSTTYTWRPDNSGTRTNGRQRTTIRAAASGDLVLEGSERHRYDDRGRLVRSEGGRRFLEYVYGADGTFTTRHNYPDTDEFCVADLVAVTRDSRGRPASDRFEGCGINEAPYTLRYEYGEGDRIATVRIDLEHDGRDEAVARLQYPSADGGCR